MLVKRACDQTQTLMRPWKSVGQAQYCRAA